MYRDNHDPVGYKDIACHLIFDVKIDLTRKSRYVAVGHITDPPLSMTYSIVVSHDIVPIDLLIEVFNYLNILAGDIQNAYLNALIKEKVFFYAGND